MKGHGVHCCTISGLPGNCEIEHLRVFLEEEKKYTQLCWEWGEYLHMWCCCMWGGGVGVSYTLTHTHPHTHTPTHLVQCWWCEEEQCSSDAEAPLYDVIQIVKVK